MSRRHGLGTRDSRNAKSNIAKLRQAVSRTSARLAAREARRRRDIQKHRA